jgi:hypothetical protein
MTMSGSIRLHLRRQHGTARKAGVRTSSAQTAFADSLDHLLDPLENLRQEEFRSEPGQATQNQATGGIAHLRHPRSLPPLWWLSVVVARLRYIRGPHQQVFGQAVFWCCVMAAAIAIGWLVVFAQGA